jgi:sugar phosphate isomerase/epimerase
MSFKLAISSTFIPDGFTLHSALKIAQELDVKIVELGSNHCHESNYEYLNDFKFEYLVHNYFPIPKNSFVLNIASPDTKIRALSLNHIKNSIEFCNKIGASLYTFHPGFLTDPLPPKFKKSGSYDFEWIGSMLAMTSYQDSWEWMIQSLGEITSYATERGVKIAIETEGSFHKAGHLLMQTPQEYERLFNINDLEDLRINLNIGHLNLAKNYFSFDLNNFIDLIASRVSALELSHNYGEEDNHLPLIQGEWYWEVITDYRFSDTFKILEFRNATSDQLISSIKLMESYHE